MLLCVSSVNVFCVVGYEALDSESTKRIAMSDQPPSTPAVVLLQSTVVLADTERLFSSVVFRECGWKERAS